MEEFVKQFRARTKLRLREDVFGRLGPKMAWYSAPPAKKGALSVGLQVPKMTALFEVSDTATVGKALDELMAMANKEFKASAAAAAAPVGGADGKAAGKAKAAKPAVPEFKLTSVSPKTYILSLPPQYAAMTNLQLTISLGKKTLAVSSSPIGAREALALESKPEGRWKPEGDLASTLDELPKGLVFLSVGDPREALPAALANLPMTLQTASTMLAGGAPPLPAAENMAGGPEARRPGRLPGGRDGSSPGPPRRPRRAAAPGRGPTRPRGPRSPSRRRRAAAPAGAVRAARRRPRRSRRPAARRLREGRPERGSSGSTRPRSPRPRRSSRSSSRGMRPSRSTPRA